MKAKIALHGNNDKGECNIKTHSATSSPLSMRILLSIAVIRRWYLEEIDFKSAFLEFGQAVRDVYGITPRESKERFIYWLLLTTDYGLGNAIPKWKEKIDAYLLSFGLCQLVYVPQKFYRNSSANLHILAIKVAEDIFASWRT